MGRTTHSFLFSVLSVSSVAIFFSGCASAPAPSTQPTLVLQGVVFETRDGAVAPLGGVLVELWAPDADPADPSAASLATTQTDASGRFRMPVPQGWEGREALLSFRAQGYETHTERYALPVEPTGEAMVVVIKPGSQDWTQPSWGMGPPGTPTNRPPPRVAPVVPATPASPKLPSQRDEWQSALSAPLFTARSNGLHYLVLVPPFDGTDVVPVRRQSWELLADFANGKFERDAGGTATLIDGTYSEFDLRWRYGLIENLEARAWVSVGGRNGDLRISTLNRTRVPEGTSDLGLGDLVVGTKYAAFRSVDGLSAASFATHIKFPTGDQNELLSTGGVDLAATAAGSQVLGPLLFQADVSVVLTGKERILKEHIVLDEVFAAAAGVSVPFKGWALLAHVESNTSAFGELGALRDTPTSAHLGFRWGKNGRTLEGGLGWGITDAASVLVAGFGVALRY